MKGRKKNPEALTEDEIKFLKSERAPETVRQFAARQHESFGVRTSAYRKVAAAARAEREALLEVATLEVVRASAEGSVVAAGRVTQLESERQALEREVDALHAKLRVATAKPAMAIHSGGAGQ